MSCGARFWAATPTMAAAATAAMDTARVSDLVRMAWNSSFTVLILRPAQDERIRRSAYTSRMLRRCVVTRGPRDELIVISRGINVGERTLVVDVHVARC